LGLEKETLMTPMEECHQGFQQWKKLGWIPYCPKGVRKYIPWFENNPFYAYNYLKYKATGKFKLKYD